MSVATTPDRSAFRNLDVASDIDRPPLSTLAIIALVSGLVSLCVPFSFVLLPLSIVAIAISAAACWRLAGDSSTRGMWMAQAGLGLGVLTSVWCLTATTGKALYLQREAVKNAKIYLDTLARGDIYQALELHQPKPSRQIAGTDLEAHYLAKMDDMEDMSREIVNSSSTKAVMELGTSADWQFAKVLDSHAVGVIHTIRVEMHNSNNPAQLVRVLLRRRTHTAGDQRAGYWSIDRLDFKDLNSYSGTTWQ